jgi:hypothetical protein
MINNGNEDQINPISSLVRSFASQIRCLFQWEYSRILHEHASLASLHHALLN